MELNKYPLSHISRKVRNFEPINYPDVRLWVAAAISHEETRNKKLLWENEPSEAERIDERLRLIRFLRKQFQNSEIVTLANRLELCAPLRRCFSGACPECGRLFQRFYVRTLRRFVDTYFIEQEMQNIAINLVLPFGAVEVGTLDNWSAANFQRSIKLRLDQARVGIGVGGIDFSFNEHQDRKWPSHFRPHASWP